LRVYALKSYILDLRLSVVCTTDPRLPTIKLICSNSHVGALALSALMMLWYYSIASTSFTSLNPLSLSVDHPAEPHRLRPHLIACPGNSVRNKTLYQGCTESRDFLLILSSLLLVHSPPEISSLQILRNTSGRHSVLMSLSLSSVTNLSLLLGFCAACMLSYRFL